MAIIINEFEILPASEPQSEALPPAPARPTTLTPEDIERIEERRIRRVQRLWAD